MFKQTPDTSGQEQSIPSWAALLDGFYERTGLSSPILNELEGPAVPQPYRALLVHSSDMTPTLASFYGQTLGLKVLSRERQGDSYKREVILWLAKDARPVEYGVIRICLDRLPQAARRLVLEEKRPLGDILQGEAIPHLSWPQAFFQVKADAHSGAALGVQRPDYLYGRRNVLLDGARHLLAEVIEVLAPAGKSDIAVDWAKPGIPTPRANGSRTAPNRRSLKRALVTRIRT